MSEQNQITVAQPPAFLAVAGLTGLDAKYLVDTVKRQCFKGEATDAQVDAFISIACEMKVNPLLPGMLYAYPISGGGIVPIMGPSGVYKKLVEHPEVASWETEVFPPDVTVPPTHAVTKIWRKGVERPLQYTALLSEWKIESNPNWRSRPRHMLALRSLKHCANQIIHGIPYDEDDRTIMAMTNVTGTDEAPQGEQPPPPPECPAPKPRATRGAAGAKNAEVVVPFEPAPEHAKVEDVQAAMQAREAKTQSQGGDVNATANVRGHTAGAVEVKPPVPSDPAPAATAPRVFLKDKEVIDAVCKIDSFTANLANPTTPFIKAMISGDFVGEVRDKTHVQMGADKKSAVADPVWVKGATVNVKLRGQLVTVEKTPSGQPNPHFGKVLNWVDGISAVDQGEAME